MKECSKREGSGGHLIYHVGNGGERVLKHKTAYVLLVLAIHRSVNANRAPKGFAVDYDRSTLRAANTIIDCSQRVLL